jgi:hypothetical protein
LLDELPALKRSLGAGKPSGEALSLIGKVVRPFVLRRTKAEVPDSDLRYQFRECLYASAQPVSILTTSANEMRRARTERPSMPFSPNPGGQSRTNVADSLKAGLPSSGVVKA